MKLLGKFENIFSAIAFAEEGEHETARQILNENRPGVKVLHEDEGHYLCQKRKTTASPAHN